MGRNIVKQMASCKLEMRSYIRDHEVAIKLLQKKQVRDVMIMLFFWLACMVRVCLRFILWYLIVVSL